jgi:hypothetical protein
MLVKPVPEIGYDVPSAAVSVIFVTSKELKACGVQEYYWQCIQASLPHCSNFEVSNAQHH